MTTRAYAAFPNRFRADLRAGKTLIGLWSSLANPISTEVCGLAGFDWIMLDGEHAPNDLNSFLAQLMALKDSPTAPVVRPSWNNPVEIKRLLDAGFFNFIIPFIETADAARAAVAATRYPPHGMRGVSISQRSNRYGTVANYWEQANEQMCVIAQIENRAGIAAAGEIAAVDGVDCLFCGPSDLSAAFGHLANPQHPEVQDAIRDVIAVARSHGKPTGILAPIEDDARRYLEMGATFVAVGSDLGLLRNATQALRERF